jgi:hypothetical protein
MVFMRAACLQLSENGVGLGQQFDETRAHGCNVDNIAAAAAAAPDIDRNTAAVKRQRQPAVALFMSRSRTRHPHHSYRRHPAYNIK